MYDFALSSHTKRGLTKKETFERNIGEHHNMLHISHLFSIKNHVYAIRHMVELKLNF